MQLWQFFVGKYSRTSPLKCAHILRRQYTVVSKIVVSKRTLFNHGRLIRIYKRIRQYLQITICIGNYTVREVLMKNRTRVWRNVYNTASA